MKVSQLQRLSDLDKESVDDVAEAICYLYGIKPSTVNAMSKNTFAKYCRKLEKDLAIAEPFFVSNKFIEDAKKITMGQFVEVTEWLRKPNQIHLIGASILKERGNHRQDAEMVNEMDAGRVLIAINIFMESYKDLLKEYDWLFQSDSDAKSHWFLKQYGWQFSAGEVARHEGIELDKAYDLPVVQALNDLCYLKGKGKYEMWLAKHN